MLSSMRLKAFDIEYIAINPGATFRGLHDSLVNYGGNHAPEIILCNHEEIAVALAHGYARAKGRPMAAAVHNVVGLQHASMAIYNAWADRLAGDRPGRHRSNGFGQSPAVDRLGAYRQRAGQSGARLLQVGRSAGERRGGAGLVYPRLSAGDHRSDGAGLYLLRRRCSGKATGRRDPRQHRPLSGAVAAASARRRFCQIH